MQPSCKLTLFDLSNSDLANFLVMMTTMMQMSHTALHVKYCNAFVEYSDDHSLLACMQLCI